MNNFISALKENKKLIIVALVVIAIVIGIMIYNNLKGEPNYNPEINDDNDIGYVKKNYKVNEYSVINISMSDLLTAYLQKYLKLQSSDPEKSYELLSKESKESFDNDINKYKKYVKENTSIYTKNNIVKKYRDGEKNNTIEIVDSEGYKYIIYEKATWDYEITLNGRE